MRFVYNGDLRYIALGLLGYFYVSDSTVYKLQQRIICTFADVLTAATSIHLWSFATIDIRLL